MSGSVTDKFARTYNAGNPNVARVSVSRSSGGGTLTCDNLAGWPTVTNSKVHFSTYKLDTNNKVIAGSQTDWVGLASGNVIGTLTRVTGAADTGNAVNDVVEMNPTASWADDLVTGITVSLDQDGTLKAGAVDNAAALASNVVTTAKILDANVTTAKIADANVTDAKMDYPRWYQEIGRTTLGSAGDTISVTSIPSRKHLRIIAHATATGGGTTSVFRFNNDSSAIYTYISVNMNAVSVSSATAQTSILANNASSGDVMEFYADLFNDATVSKSMSLEFLVHNPTSTAFSPGLFRIGGQWSNTSAQINRIDLINTGAGDFASGSYLIVLGHD